ncbi:(2Fe-2S)-binding protein [Vibrio sp. T187]|uniref:(2Fe-2S)-binding protein n=1 Tax=Vibrio TaxID=662 RepID=UPI0010CA0380|nr:MULTISPECIES: (2Fe-2S)-binding protein [Vibrio]MBW3697390.1 (2Fe-2S)-binding protein [Vibrio sp. T187]
MFVCLCNAVSDKTIRKLVREEGITDVKGIKKCTALGSQCGKCIKQAKVIIEENTIECLKLAS